MYIHLISPTLSIIGSMRSSSFLTVMTFHGASSLPGYSASLVTITIGSAQDPADGRGLMPVHIVWTGVEDRFSAPITFASMQKQDMASFNMDSDGRVTSVCTTLQIASRFLQDLETREVAALGTRPDFTDTNRNLRAGYLYSAVEVQSEADEIGWQPEWEPLQHPSSQWVNESLIPQWIPETIDHGEAI